VDPFTKTVQVTGDRLRRNLGTTKVIKTTPVARYRISDTAVPAAQRRRPSANALPSG
jgi:hypothetical protein